MAKTQTPTQDFRNLDITGIVNGFAVSVETSRKTIHTRIEDLKEYVQKEGFEHDGIWYFRRSWMDEESARVFEKAGLMERLGTVKSLRDQIPFPDEKNYTGSQKIYRLNLPNGN